LEAEVTPSKLRRNPHLATRQLATAEVSNLVSVVASGGEAVASEGVSVAIEADLAETEVGLEEIEVGLAEVSGAIEVGMEEEVVLATKVAVASVADPLLEHLADLAADEAATTTREMDMAVVGMVEAVIVAQLVATETPSVVEVEVAVGIDTTTEIGMAGDDEMMIMALESDTMTATLTTTQGQNADIKETSRTNSGLWPGKVFTYCISASAQHHGMLMGRMSLYMRYFVQLPKEVSNPSFR